MSWSRWLRRFCVPRRPVAPRATFRPQLQALEDRLVPTVTYQGGPLLPAVEVQAYYLGQSWSTSPDLQAQAAQLDSALGNIVTGSYLDMLGNAGYGVGHGSTRPGYLETSYEGNGGYTDADIRNALLNQIGQGLAYPDPNRLYVVFTDPGMVVTRSNGTNSAHDFYGYHSAFVDSWGETIRYAVVASPGGPNLSPIPGLDTFDSMTFTASHEIAEAVTDPDRSLRATGWFENGDPNNEGEIGDIAGNQAIAYYHDFAVQETVDQNDQLIVPLDLQLTQVGQPADVAIVPPIQGESFTAQVALGEGNAPATDLVTTIDWGDGTSSAGVVDSNPNPNGGFIVSGTHTYTSHGNFQILVTVSDPSNVYSNPAYGTGQMYVEPNFAVSPALVYSAGADEAAIIAAASAPADVSPAQQISQQTDVAVLIADSTIAGTDNVPPAVNTSAPSNPPDPPPAENFALAPDTSLTAALAQPTVPTAPPAVNDLTSLDTTFVAVYSQPAVPAAPALTTPLARPLTFNLGRIW
jgi:hypothetical protein